MKLRALLPIALIGATLIPLPAAETSPFELPTAEALPAITGTKVDLYVGIHAPKYVKVGDPFTAVVEIRASSSGATVVQVLPLEAQGPCMINEMHVSGGVGLGAGYYLLTSGPTLAPMLDHRGDPEEPLNVLDISMGFGTRPQEEDPKICVVGISYIQLSEQLTQHPAIPVEAAVELLDVLPSAVALGEITTRGGNDVDDSAQVTVPALPETTIVVLTPRPKLLLSGVITHLEIGPTIADDGQFEIRENNVPITQATLTRSGDTKPLVTVRPLAHEKGQTVKTEYCLGGVYIDGGAWTSVEGPALTCTVVSAVEPADRALDARLLEEACTVFEMPTTQADLALYGVALEPRLRHVISASQGSPHWNGVGDYFMFDPAFGELCDG
jgi:hypothetical protein